VSFPFQNELQRCDPLPVQTVRRKPHSPNGTRQCSNGCGPIFSQIPARYCFLGMKSWAGGSM
jgi:hypothetical protein